MKKYTFNILIFMALCLLASCDLQLQKPFEYEPELPPFTTFKDKTALDWLKTQKTADTAKTLNLERFDLMLAAIDSAGLRDEYTKSGDQRTFLLLNNGAFLGTSRIISVVGGTTSTTLLKLPALTAANKLKLVNILKYHIIDAYVDQVKALPVADAHYDFKTLGAAPNDVISMRRDVRFNLTINGSPSLPTTKRTFTVFRHNYQFANGIAHIVNNYAQVVAF